MAESETTCESRFQRLSGQLGRCAAGVSTFTLGISVAAMAMAQSSNGHFQAAPKSPETEAVEAEAAAQVGDMIFGIPVNTIFFVAVGVVALFWFTMGGGRKAKVTGQQS